MTIWKNIGRDAVIKGNYRYVLTRYNADALDLEKYVTFILLNPSIADGTADDRTTKRCMGFTQRWGYEHMKIVNLFAYRSTDPSKLKELTRAEAIGEENEKYVREIVQGADKVVFGWGVNGTIHGESTRMKRLLSRFGKRYYCFDILTDGEPKFPLYVAANKELREYPLPIEI